MLTVLPFNTPVEFPDGNKLSVLEILSTNGYLLESNCGGRGTCGKCLIELVNGVLYNKEGNVVTPDNGNRYLACQVYPREDCTVKIEISQAASKASSELISKKSKTAFPKRVGLAIDIGSTTVAAMLVDLSNNDILAVETETNPQRAYGADVISRIDFACREHSGKNGVLILQELIVQCLNSLISRITTNYGYSSSALEAVYIGGNTTMLQLFWGIEPKGLAVAPYRSDIAGVKSGKAGEIGLDLPENTPVITLPVIASFVGADTVAAVLEAGIDRSDSLSLMIDLGTNAEIVLGKNGRMLATSTAAGPAFEGSQLKHGMRAVPGAIHKIVPGNRRSMFDARGSKFGIIPGSDGLSRTHSQVQYERQPDLLNQDGELDIDVIGGIPATGICGSGMVDAIAALRTLGIITPSGRLLSGKEYILVKTEDSGNGQDITVTQADIREIQLVKASISAGIKILLEAYGEELSSVIHIFVAGAFGNYINLDNARLIGLLPNLPGERFHQIGNAAGLGVALSLAGGQDFLARAENIVRETQHVELASYNGFQNRFIKSLNLEEGS